MIFNDLDHSYVNDKGEKYTSATQFVKKFVKPFERDKKATAFAKKNKRPVEDVLADWEKASSDAIRKGSAYHSLKELELLNLGSIVIDDHEHIVYPSEWDKEGANKIARPLKLEPGIYPELILWSDRYKIAGQADYIEITKSGKINITDYKTSKEIKKNGWKKWDGSTDKMLYPLNNLEDCNFNHYCIQINLYAFLLKQHNRNLKIGDLKIEHVVCEYNDETDQVEVKEVNTHIVPYMQDEVKTALDYFKQKQELI